MKSLKYFFISMLAIVFATSCNEGIDPITPIAPGTDASAPALTIKYPLEGTLIRVKEDVTPINFQLEAEDDIEIKSISLKLDGTEITSFNDFKDYRRAIKEYLYNNLTNGSHTLAITVTDLSGKSTTKSVNFEKIAPYKAKYANETFYMPFDGDYMELLSITNATKVGNPGFSEGKVGKAYAGATDAYLTFPTAGLQSPEFSAVFWMKVNAVPDRAGILVMGPVDPAAPNAMNNRKNGFRFFREGSATKQTFKLNVGNGTTDAWFDGGTAASIDPAAGQWVHMAFTISKSKSECVVYFNGQVVKQGSYTEINWAGCDILSIMSGAPRFSGWNHKSDNSLMDELRLFNKALTPAEIQTIMNAEK
ncbi:MAG: hypothetical protein JNL03_05780 [Prolixibacteraceae bacterium]|nr:hypothetical protein [Prolixibacteraceae bacterium]